MHNITKILERFSLDETLLKLHEIYYYYHRPFAVNMSSLGSTLNANRKYDFLYDYYVHVGTKSKLSVLRDVFFIFFVISINKIEMSFDSGNCRLKR